jgi:hypothetical protein
MTSTFFSSPFKFNHISLKIVIPSAYIFKLILKFIIMWYELATYPDMSGVL